MTDEAIQRVALVGAGIIGRSWIYVFARAGRHVAVFDNDPVQLKNAVDWYHASLEHDVNDGFLTAERAEAMKTSVSAHSRLEDAVEGADYIQESGPEDPAIKRSIYNRLDKTARPQAIIGSSTSGLNLDEITKGLRIQSRCLVAHPCNPPHIIPAVEVLPTQKTTELTLDRTVDFLKEIGQKPIRINFYIIDYVINRLQSALMKEAIHLVQREVADVAAVDAAIRDGLGLRWALLGVFGVNHTNADGGIGEYYDRYGESYVTGMADLDWRPPSFDSNMIRKIAAQVEEMTGGAKVQDICNWRDRLVRKILALKQEDPAP